MISWEPAPAQISLAKNAIHLWRVSLELAPQQIAELARTLSPDESQRASRFHFERDRRRFRAAHGALRQILSRYRGCTPDQVQYQLAARGKPSLVEPFGLYFNLTHSHELALVALTSLGEIGVDVEQVRPLEDMDQLARRCFSEQEYQQFHTLAAPENQRAFFNGWTRKEAYIKATGDGLSQPLDQFSVSLLPDDPACLRLVMGQPTEAAHWTLHTIELGPEYAAAFALRAIDVTVQYWYW